LKIKKFNNNLSFYYGETVQEIIELDNNYQKVKEYNILEPGFLTVGNDLKTGYFTYDDSFYS
jgi:hypothetical protein